MEGKRTLGTCRRLGGEKAEEGSNEADGPREGAIRVEFNRKEVRGS